MARIASFIYGALVYVFMFLVFLYLFAFLADVLVPTTVDSNIASSYGAAFAVNLGLILLFGVQHSVMARPAFKRWWTQIVPKPIERSTYVLISSLLFALLFWQWRPMEAVVWSIDSGSGQALMWSLYGFGIVLLFASTFVINHFDLFGLRQIWLNLVDKPYTYLKFKVTFLYRFVRHPLYVGWFLIFWATPHMTAGHLLLAIGMSAYILIAIRYEERDMVEFHGDAYREYQRTVPKFLPKPGHVHDTVKPQEGAPLVT
ncbi:MAG: methanethiol S-methyltransferase [Gammaproteobacteria bacterium]